MLRIRATNRTIVGYVRCARFPQMQALASLFACGQPAGVQLQSNGTAFVVRNPRFGIKKGTAFAVPFFGGDAGFVANIVCVITERKCLHFKAECQPGYRGSHGDAVLRFFKIAINPRIDDIEKQVEQEVQLVSRLVEMRGFEPRFVLLHPTPSTCLFGD